MSRRFFSMSGNFDDPPSDSTSESPFQTAERLVQDILQNGPGSNAQISPSGELYRAIERYTQERRAEHSVPTRTNPETAQNMSSSERRTERQSRSVRRRPRRASIHPMLSQTFEAPTDDSESSHIRRRLAWFRAQNGNSMRHTQEEWAEFDAREQARARLEVNVREQDIIRLAQARHPEDRQQDTARPGLHGRRRPPLFQSDRYMEPQRALHDGHLISPGFADSILQLGDLQPPSERAENSSHPSSRFSSPEYVAEGEHNRRVKRRKLDQGQKTTSWEGFKYGRYGQVEPGTLQMEIVSCDGGLYQSCLEGEYGSENVLKDDNTVYCTKSNRCNMVLKHQGETTFSLTEIVIKAPPKGYTAPVQEGMVFISGSSNDLLTRTAQYQIQYSSPLRNTLPSIRSIRHNVDGTTTVSTAQARAGRLVALGAQDPECDLNAPLTRPTAQIPSDFTNITSPYQVTMECSSDFSDNEDQPLQNRRRRRFSLRAAQDDDYYQNVEVESSDDEDLVIYRRFAADQDFDPDLGSLMLPAISPRLRRRETASNITLAEAVEASQIATQEAVRAVGGELMVPHAKFFIERDKSKCTIKFSTPISGKYILLKLWSPDGRSNGNIDIQSVVAKGFAGPRYFPKVDFM